MSSNLEVPSKEGSTIVDLSQEDQKLGEADVAKVAVEEVKPSMPTFPEGGLRAWLVVFGVSNLI
jgi:hypothetical protein